ncbi:glycoside hydrolase family 18 protein [Moniliophthora roreri MCA 2997]|uniref:Glycoside hydrolase family 18 protein n=2 Tax=Moniliophthora roreri TaxID=221103 RepID=V2XFE7_MONRO|nr:glycoside hydrolase family 18 protein [Moniliophthora roreri MCA 2997]
MCLSDQPQITVAEHRPNPTLVLKLPSINGPLLVLPRTGSLPDYHYGYVSQSTKTTLTRSFAPLSDMVLLQQDADNKSFLNGAYARTQPSKQIQRRPQQQQTSGALVEGAGGNYRAGGEFTMAWDDGVAPQNVICAGLGK